MVNLKEKSTTEFCYAVTYKDNRLYGLTPVNYNLEVGIRIIAYNTVIVICSG